MAKRVTFLRDFDHRPRMGVIIAWKRGMRALVPEDCVRKALAAGAVADVAEPLSASDGRRRDSL